MHIRVLVPSEEHLATAGVRIRYQRLGAKLRENGHLLEVMVIDAVQPNAMPRADFYLLCKCHDARSLVLAADLKSRGAHLGADFFDDYYSQAGDSRFVHIREWLRDIAPYLTFALCSTPLMLETLNAELPHVPSHLVNDPCDTVDEETLGHLIDAKIERTRATRRIDIGWFGIGDNPHFPVGISDLKDFSGQLQAFSRSGFAPRLSVITNRRALTPDRLELLSRLPIPWHLEEWSDNAERQLVSESYVCFIPVNAQRFSTVKSLNRCVTALTGGAQVLSAGFPLYRCFGDFVYRNASDVVEDLRYGTPKLRAASLAPFLNLLSQHASVAEEAHRLEGFLLGLPPVRAIEPASAPIAVVHGRLSTSMVHKFAQRFGHLSVAGPWSAAPLNYDVKFALLPGSNRPVILLSDRASKQLLPEAAARLETTNTRDGKFVSCLPLQPGLLATSASALAAKLAFDSVLASNYTEFMQAVEAELTELFPSSQVIFSEYSAPFRHEAKRPAADPAQGAA
jgi:hypothetical protein